MKRVFSLNLKRKWLKVNSKTAFNPIIFVGFQIKLVLFENQTLFNTTVKGIN